MAERPHPPASPSRPSASSQPPVSDPPSFPLRLAAIDVGSNALRFGVAEFTGPEQFRLLESQRVAVRLGHAAFRRRRLQPERIQQAVAAIAGFRARMEALEVHHHRAVATSAVRESENGPELIQRVREETGIQLIPIRGTEEGRLVWRAIRSRLPLEGYRWLLADLGGGSLELSLAESTTLRWTESLSLGTVRLLEELAGEGGGSSEALRTLIEACTGAADLPTRLGAPVEALIATGGNADFLADLAGEPADAQGVRRLTCTRMGELIDQLAALSVEQRIQQLGLREDRADVIFPAAVVYEWLARLAATETILVPGVGLKEGVILDLMDDLSSPNSRDERLTRELQEGAIALGRRYRFDEAHGRQVARLSLHLYDALQDLHGLSEAERRILLVAALLHDVGKVVATRKHHKHSRYLLRHAELPGLSAGEMDLAALVARYHRGARPRKTQRVYGSLESADRKRVKTLAALLRVGDALDHDHTQTVQEVSVVPGAEEVTLHLVAAGDAPLKLASLERRGKLFQRVFQRALRVARGEPTTEAHHPSPLHLQPDG